MEEIDRCFKKINIEITELKEVNILLPICLCYDNIDEFEVTYTRIDENEYKRIKFSAVGLIEVFKTKYRDGCLKESDIIRDQCSEKQWNDAVKQLCDKINNF